MTLSNPSQRSKSFPQLTQLIPVKVFHWLNIISLLLMITSGLQIYNANAVFGGRNGPFAPAIFTLGGWLAGGRHWHFAAMWLFAINLFCYGIYILITRRWQHRFVHKNDIKALQVSQNQKRRIYAWHRLSYTAIIPVLLLAILSGLGLYKPAQFHGIVDLFGGWQGLRIVHFLIVPTVLLFTRIHAEWGFKIGGIRMIKSIFW
ncbi:MAG TPA: thiosulfate reductase cytochrome B subunit (membrane anchoring protein) [Cyanobacteria bacterium UBA11162]|nr:thiosulfate reductase cytochrome B subunit (membrane anchoring protein) [Cyanobacteria bacterium UBA11162]